MFLNNMENNESVYCFNLNELDIYKNDSNYKGYIKISISRDTNDEIVMTKTSHITNGKYKYEGTKDSIKSKDLVKGTLTKTECSGNDYLK